MKIILILIYHNTLQIDGDKKDTTTEFEHCVLCGRVTSVRKNTHINHRIVYVEGVGQLCCECALKLH